MARVSSTFRTGNELPSMIRLTWLVVGAAEEKKGRLTGKQTNGASPCGPCLDASTVGGGSVRRRATVVTSFLVRLRAPLASSPLLLRALQLLCWTA